MNGLELAEAYYQTHGVPMIADRFAPFADRIAVGLVGPGSECFGFDDSLSRDHDWGPGFCLWLTDEDFAAVGADLQAAYDNLPRTFRGFGPRRISPGEEFRTGPSPIVDFYKTYTGLDHPPSRPGEWLSIPESALATCTNGRVFSDPPGRFSRWREALLAYYPEDVRLKKIASRCLTAAQAGQYNLARSYARNEPFAVQYAETKFCVDIISLTFLLNRTYTPFYKWMHRAVRRQPILGRKIHALIGRLLKQTEIETKLSLVEAVCAAIAARLRAEGLSDSPGDFLLDHARSIHRRISDPRLGGITVVD